MTREAETSSANIPPSKWTTKSISKFSIGAIAILAFVFFVTRNGCDNPLAGLIGFRHLNVDTWAEWGDQISGVDMFKKYNAFSVSYHADSIRSDFVRQFHPYFVAECAATYLDGAQSDDKVVQELVRLRMIGVWNEGTTLHLSNQIGIDVEDKFLEKWSLMIQGELRKSKSEQSKEAYVIYGTISSMFEKLVLHGPGGQTDIIKLAFDFGK